MTWLIDTNVISEIRKGPRCNQDVRAWWADVRESDLFLSVLTTGEIRRGIAAVRPRNPEKAAVIEVWLAEVVAAFGSRILAVDAKVSDAWGRMTATRSIPTIDALLAATASVHKLILVTRNIGDVANLGVSILNPFASR